MFHDDCRKVFQVVVAPSGQVSRAREDHSESPPLAEMNLPIRSPKAGVRTLTFDSDVLSRQVSLKHRVWQRRLLVPVGPYTRKTLAIGG